MDTTKTHSKDYSGPTTASPTNMHAIDMIMEASRMLTPQKVIKQETAYANTCDKANATLTKTYSKETTKRQPPESPEDVVQSLDLSSVERKIQKATSRMFIEVGELLKLIRDRRLFEQDGFSEFEPYISSQTKLGFDYKTAIRNIGAFETVQALPPSCPRPLLISHAIPLVGLPLETLAGVWQEVLTLAKGVEHVTTRLVTRIKDKWVHQGSNASSDIEELRASISVDPEHTISNNWNTPRHIVEAARDVFGGTIDTDPCSNNIAQSVVRATNYYTAAQDGLLPSNVWTCNVWVNPPYGMFDSSKGMQQMFLERALVEHGKGNVDACILLVKAAIGYKWFHNVLDHPHCFLQEKLKFEKDGKSGNVAPFGSVVVYIGDDVAKFAKVFGQMGKVAGFNSWSYPKQ
jgi:hypothetical protein